VKVLDTSAVIDVGIVLKERVGRESIMKGWCEKLLPAAIDWIGLDAFIR